MSHRDPSHSDPEFLALAALGEPGGTEADSAHLARCPDCQRDVERLSQVVGLSECTALVSAARWPKPLTTFSRSR